MIQRSEVLAEEANRISLVSARRAAAEENYLSIVETAIPVNTTEQAWIFNLGDEIRAGRTTPGLVNPFVKIANWLSHLGSGKIDDSCLESRHNIHHNFKINSIRF
jgi:hypothetical protein